MTLNLVSSGTNDVQGTLINASGAVLAQDNNSAGAPNFLIVTNVAAGTYFLKVTGTGLSKGSYTVLAKWTAAPVTVGAPEIGLLGLNSTPIPDGALTAKTTDGTDFGEVDLSNGSRSTSFSVRNTGKATLTLGTVQLSGSGAAQFRVTTQVPSTVAAGRSAAFQITYNPTTVGRHQASVSLSNNDANESSYDFVIVGSGTSSTDDVGNTPATATRVAVPSTTPARLNVAQDQDVFRFVLSQAATVSPGNLVGCHWPDGSRRRRPRCRLQLPHPSQVVGGDLLYLRSGLLGHRDGRLRTPDHPVILSVTPTALPRMP